MAEAVRHPSTKNKSGRPDSANPSAWQLVSRDRQLFSRKAGRVYRDAHNLSNPDQPRLTRREAQRKLGARAK